MTMIGIMQGRLLPPQPGHAASFPREHWKDEFAHAASLSFDYIEWIYDLYGKDVNPITTPETLEQLKDLSTSSKVSIRSLCANYFMDKLPVRCTDEEREKRVQEFATILRNGRAIGLRRAVIPFLDASAIRTPGDFSAVVEILTALLPIADETGVELHLETSLTPVEYARLLGLLPNPTVKVTYDSGNSASLGYSPAEEFAAYGERIGSVHIKDRVLHGSTVPLGTGNADFEAVFAGLRRLEYRGDFTFEVARSTAGDECAWAKKNLSFLRNHWQD